MRAAPRRQGECLTNIRAKRRTFVRALLCVLFCATLSSFLEIRSSRTNWWMLVRQDLARRAAQC